MSPLYACMPPLYTHIPHQSPYMSALYAICLHCRDACLHYMHVCLHYTHTFLTKVHTCLHSTLYACTVGMHVSIICMYASTIHRYLYCMNTRTGSSSGMSDIYIILYTYIYVYKRKARVYWVCLKLFIFSKIMLCVYIYIYIYMYVCMYVCMYTCIYRPQLNTYANVQLFAQAVGANVFMLKKTQLWARVCAYVCRI
jgi:hypothetical protein